MLKDGSVHTKEHLALSGMQWLHGMHGMHGIHGMHDVRMKCVARR